MRYALIGLVCAAAILWGLAWLFVRPTVAEEGRIPFGGGLEVAYRVTNEGGALGNVRYEVFAERDGRRDRIFHGQNGGGFHIGKDGPGGILIRLCNGIVDHVSPVPAIADHGPVMVRSDVHCSDRK